MGTITAVKTENAVAELINMGEQSNWKLQHYLNRRANSTIYEIHKDLGWSIGKAQATVNRLKEKGLVKIKEAVSENERQVKLIYLTPAEELMVD